MIIIFAFIASINLTSFSQEVNEIERKKITLDQTYTYAYIKIERRLFSKKLAVKVDFGDTPEQKKAGKEYSKLLSNKKSYAAILNYMTENQFELVETLDHIFTYMGSGGTSDIVFIMRKKN